MKAKMLNPYDVRVGQVWESCDKRGKGCRSIVERIEGDKAVVRGWSMGNIGGPERRIRLDRFREISTGYRLIR